MLELKKFIASPVSIAAQAMLPPALTLRENGGRVCCITRKRFLGCAVNKRQLILVIFGSHLVWIPLEATVPEICRLCGRDMHVMKARKNVPKSHRDADTVCACALF